MMVAVGVGGISVAVGDAVGGIAVVGTDVTLAGAAVVSAVLALLVTSVMTGITSVGRAVGGYVLGLTSTTAVVARTMLSPLFGGVLSSPKLFTSTKPKIPMTTTARVTTAVQG